VFWRLNDHGQFGIAYDETDPAKADRETIIRNFLTGQYGNALRVVADKHLGSNKVAAEGQRGSSSDFVASSSARPADIPSRIPYSGTKPTTIAGWTVRKVYSGMATLEGPGGIRRAARGDTAPRVGRVKAILRWDGRWIVLTSSGVISTR
jgi:hypothetical protein